ncbi:MAG: hypothetical protein OEV91_09250 [Desulfobulbaceae bacterium]|nr:hypothetical protein [Desulfobulbaceae bacterium]
MVALLTVGSLLPIWWFRFLPMQDYPQHLFMVKVLQTFQDSGLDWSRYYDVDLRIGPYSLFYLVTFFFSYFAGIESAGKLFVSLYVLLVVALIIRESRRSARQGHLPWGVLLLFPFMFHQIYYMGFANYLISIPLLFLVMGDFEDFVHGDLTGWSVLKHLGYLVALSLAHPFTVLVAIVFMVAAAMVHYRAGRPTAPRALVAPVVLAVLFAGWYWGAVPGEHAGAGGAGWSMRWFSLYELLSYYAIMFIGQNRDYSLLSAAALLLWAVVGFVLFRSEGGERDGATSAPELLFWGLALLGYLVLPFWIKGYAYFNLRLAPVTYFLLALLAGQRRLTGQGKILLVAALAGIMVVPFLLHQRLSSETEEILPLLHKMERNAAVLPYIEDAAPRAIDPVIFNEFHRHDHFYYHVLVGGGANPAIFQSPLIPVQFRKDFSLPRLASNFRGADFSAYYRYLLVRGALPEAAAMPEHLSRRAQFGKWTLLEGEEKARRRWFAPGKGLP